MNKHSKYRKLMDNIELGIATHEMNVNHIYQTMMNVLDKAEEEHDALSQVNKQLREHIKRKDKQLFFMAENADK